MIKRMNKRILLTAAAALFSANSFAEVTRHALPNNNPFPISRAVEVTPDANRDSCLLMAKSSSRGSFWEFAAGRRTSSKMRGCWLC